MKRKDIINAVITLLIFLFVYAAFSKVQDFEKFEVELGKSPLLAPFASFMAWFIPAIEIVIAVGLALQKTQMFGLYASFTLMVIFTAYIITILNFADYIPCSCGGVIQNLSWSRHLLFNLVFVLLAAFGVIIYPQRRSSCI